MSGPTNPPANGADEAGPFAFTKANAALAEEIIGRYPEDRQASAVMPLLDLAQRQNGGWLPRPAVEYVADYLGMPHIRVYEVVTFYSMFNLKPVGRNQVRVCTTTPCWLCGSAEVLDACRETLGIDLDETSEDGEFTLTEVECIGACVNAPVIQINDDYYEDLDGARTAALLDLLKKGEKPKPGSQTGRQCSAPVKGLATLISS
ncbi:MAG: NADH-quinone oxidoreductase subunit NuoE, partial [Alphaproteobacteria bacterium]